MFRLVLSFTVVKIIGTFSDDTYTVNLEVLCQHQKSVYVH